MKTALIALLLVVLTLAAFVSRPDARSFARFADEGHAPLLEMPDGNSLDVSTARPDPQVAYKFADRILWTVQTTETGIAYVGLFGRWWAV